MFAYLSSCSTCVLFIPQTHLIIIAVFVSIGTRIYSSNLWTEAYRSMWRCFENKLIVEKNMKLSFFVQSLLPSIDWKQDIRRHSLHSSERKYRQWRIKGLKRLVWLVARVCKLLLFCVSEIQCICWKIMKNWIRFTLGAVVVVCVTTDTLMRLITQINLEQFTWAANSIYNKNCILSRSTFRMISLSLSSSSIHSEVAI